MKEQPTTKKPPVQRLAFTVTEAAASIGTSPSTVRNLMNTDPTFPYVTLGRKSIIPVDKLNQWLSDHI